MPSLLYLKSLPYPRSFRFSPMLSARSFTLLHLRSMVHFELIFCEECKVCVWIFFFHINVQLFQHYLLKRLFSHHCLALLLCQRSVDYYVGHIMTIISILFHISICLFFSNITLPWLLWLYLSLAVGWCQSSNFVLLLQYCDAYSVSFALPYTH